MRTTKKISIVIVTALLFFAFFSQLHAQSQKSTVEKLLDILQNKGIITEEQQQELTEELGEEQKVLEEHKQAVQDVKNLDEKRPHLGYNNGFFLETPDEKFKLKMGGRVYGDFRGFNSGHPSNSEFYISRARIHLAGTFYKYFGFRVQADFGKGDSKLKDGFITLNYFPHAQVIMGQFKAPFSLERMTSANYINFIERALPVDNLTPDRDIGIELFGAYMPIGLHYAVGVFNGTRANEGDSDNHKDLVARIGISPFAKRDPCLLNGLHLGFSTTYGKQDLTYPDDKDYIWNKGELKTAGATKWFQIEKGVVLDGTRTRLGTELAWVIGPITLQGEWIRVDLDDIKNPSGERHDLSMKGYYIQGSYFVTGEEQQFDAAKAIFKRPKLKRIFDPSKGLWGAFQLCIRYDRLDVSSGFFDYGYSNNLDYTDGAKSFTVGINWYLNDMVRVMLNYNHVEFDDYVADADDDWEDVFLARFQLDF